jgi:hypothetical protein
MRTYSRSPLQELKVHSKAWTFNSWQLYWGRQLKYVTAFLWKFQSSLYFAPDNGTEAINRACTASLQQSSPLSKVSLASVPPSPLPPLETGERQIETFIAKGINWGYESLLLRRAERIAAIFDSRCPVAISLSIVTVGKFYRWPTFFILIKLVKQCCHFGKFFWWNPNLFHSKILPLSVLIS